MNIEQIFYAITTTVTLALAVMTLQRMLSGWWRQYYLLAIILVLMLLGVVPSLISYISSTKGTVLTAHKMYWVIALLSQVATFSLVIQFVSRAGREMATQSLTAQWLAFGAFIAAGVSTAVHFDKSLNTFMALVTRDLTFMTALANMVLWRFLLRMKKRPFLLLAVSAGLGIQCTADAIGHSFRLLSRQLGSVSLMYDFGNVLMSLSSVITVAIWHTAFSRSKYQVPAPKPATGPAIPSPN